jgi:hypothetical protein
MSEETMTPQEGSGELTISDATSAIEGMLSASEDSNEQPETVENTEVEEVEELEEEETDESEEEESDDADEDDSEIEDEDEVEEEQTFTVKAAGEEKQVTLDELKKSYQLGSDYTKKTQELAEQRKVIETEAKAIIEARQVRDEYSQRLQAVEQFLTGTNDSQEDLTSMKENDPIGYAVRVAEMTEKKEQLQLIRAEQSRIAQQQQADRNQQMQKFIQQEAAKLTEVLPEFSDKTKGEQIRNEIRNYGKQIGFTDEELGSVYDSRHVLTLHKAMMYDKLVKSKPGMKKKVSEAPRMAKNGAKVKESVTDKTKKQMQRLRQTGSARDAAAIFENFM